MRRSLALSTGLQEKNDLRAIERCVNMGKQKKTRKFSVAKKIVSAKDTRMSAQMLLHADSIGTNLCVSCSIKNQEKVQAVAKDLEKTKKNAERHIEQAPTALFFQYNTQLGPPYHVLVDTNFLNFSIKNKLEVIITACAIV